MLADGTVHTLDRTHEPELFRAVLGGYGLFGVVLEAELDLVDSEMYELTQRTVAYDRFPDLFRDELWPDDRYRLMYAHLSTSPDSLLREAVVYTYETTAAGEPVPPLREPESMAFGRFVLNLARTGEVGQRVKWAAQRHLLPPRALLPALPQRGPARRGGVPGRAQPGDVQQPRAAAEPDGPAHRHPPGVLPAARPPGAVPRRHPGDPP